MRTALVSLIAVLAAGARLVGFEGLLVIVGTACLAVAAGFVHPAGPWAVIGGVTLLLGFAVAWRSG